MLILNVIFIFVITFFVLLSYKLDKTIKKIYTIITSFSILIFCITSILVFNEKIGHMYVYDNIDNLVNGIYFSIFLLLCQLFPTLLVNFKKNKVNLLINNDSISLNLILSKFLVLLIVVITVVNFYRTDGFSQLIIQPRQYELLFGKYVFLNYIYFLNVFFCSYFYLLYYYKKRTYYLILCFLILFTGMFFGHKSAFIDVFIPLFICIFLTTNNRKYLFLISFSIFLFVIFYFENVRGGGMFGAFDYLIQGTVNFLYRLEDDYFYFFNYQLLFLFDNDLPFGFPLNPKYNTTTAYYNLWGGGRFLSILLLYLIIYLILLKLSKNVNWKKILLISILSLPIIMMFFSFRFLMYKYLYLFLIALIFTGFNNGKYKKISN